MAATACVRRDCPGGGFLDDEGLCTVCDRPPERGVAGRASPAQEAGRLGVGLRAPSPSGPPPVWATAPWASALGSEGSSGRVAVPRIGRRSGSTTATSARSRLGVGLVPVPPVPRRDPEAAVLDHAQVPESQRLCGNPECRAAVGRSADGSDAAAGPLTGVCPQCQTPYSFEPTLHDGDLVGQYQVRGPIAHGGQGWIYLARDVNLDGDPVVLKGLLQAGDAEAYNAFVTERRFLIEVKHPAIVQIRNFVQRHDDATGSAAGYIVMEYVDGKSLRQVLDEQRDAGLAGIPVPQAIAYTLEILTAFGYLHDAGLLFCDLKPDNVMLVEDRLKLIDLGAVRRVGDRTGAVWASPGYAAPEVERGLSYPSVTTDLYTVGRTLAVLTVPGAADVLPDPRHSAVLRDYEAYYRFLRRATDQDPEARFSSADEMAEQLTGVLRQVLAADGGSPPPVASARFTAEPAVASTDVHARLDPPTAASALPTPREDRDDPAAGFLATLDGVEPAAAVRQLAAAPLSSPAVTMRLIRAQLASGTADDALTSVTRALDGTDATGSEATADWRLIWHRGLVTLALDRPLDAARAFESVLDAAPGELAPQLALAACAELAGAPQLALHYYETVWRTDPTSVGAAFGIARALLADAAQAPEKRRARAVTVLESVPSNLHHHVAAWIAALRLRLHPDDRTGTGLRAAADRMKQIPLDEPERARLRSELFESACDWLDGGGKSAPHETTAPLDGVAFDQRALRRALADSYLVLARHAHDRRERESLVDRAYRVRPTTLF